MTVKYNPYFGIVLCSLSVCVILLHLYLFSLTGKLGVGFYSAIVVLLLGIGYIRGTYFIVSENTISIFNSWGVRVKKYEFSSFSDIYTKNSKFYINNNTGKIQRLKISKFMSDPADWKNFLRYINRGNLAEELHDL